MYHSGIKNRQTNIQALLNIVNLCNKPCSSTNPLSWSDFPQEGWEQVKCPGHQVRPRAVMNGPLAIKSNFLLTLKYCFTLYILFYYLRNLDYCEATTNFKLTKLSKRLNNNLFIQHFPTKKKI